MTDSIGVAVIGAGMPGRSTRGRTATRRQFSVRMRRRSGWWRLPT
jgi:hypothetical protein